MVVQDKARAKNLLQRHMDSIQALHQSSVDSQEFTKWRRDTRVAIENIFGKNSSQSTEFGHIIFRGHSPSNLVRRDAYTHGLERAEAILQSMIDEIEEYWPDGDQAQNPAQVPQIQKQANTNQVFIIHGRDTVTRDLIAGILRRLELEPVILQEQPDRSRTIIEKFEDYAQVGFAIALFTPDDFGGLEGDDPQSRARQNVVFEFGYFIGKYGRERVRALVKGNIEIPTDYSGVTNILLDNSDGWKFHLARELKSAGFDVDANRLL